MKRAGIACLAALAAAFLAACGGIGASYDRYAITAAPRAINADLPPSLVEPAADSATGRCAIVEGAPIRSERWGAFHWIKRSAWQSQKRLARTAAAIVLLDYVIVSRELVPGTAAEPTVVAATAGIVWTQGMVDAYAAMIPASFLGDPRFKAEARLPAAGETASLPGFSYWAIDTAADPTSLYDVAVAFQREGDDREDDEYQATKTLYWNSEKTLFKLTHKLEDLSDPAKPVAVEETFVAYDAASSSLTAGRQDRRGSMSLQLAKDAASTTNGYFIAFDASLTSRAEDFDDDAALRCGAFAGAALSFKATGYADDSGGTISETLTLTPAAGSPLVFYLKESFDAAGHLTLVQFSTDGIAYVTLPGFSKEGARDRYEPKAGEAGRARARMDGSALSGDIRREMERHAGEVPEAGS